MSPTLAEGEVIVTLSCLAPTSLTFPQRRLLLSNQKRAVSIGRASKRSSTLEPRMYNGWIDAPVMSRQHAELKLNSQSQTVFVRDVGSLHGTYHNDTRLRSGQSQALADGDILKFGISIERGRESFPQCTMKVALEFGENRGDSDVEITSTTGPAVFQVPDETDCDDMDSPAAFSSIDGDDEDDLDHLDEPSLRTSAAVLNSNCLELTEFHGFETSDPIDLTSEPDLVSEDNIPSSSSPASEAVDLPVHEGDYTLGTVSMEADLDSFDDGPIGVASEGFPPARQYKDANDLACEENKRTTPGAYPAEQFQPAIFEAVNSLRRAESLGAVSGKPEYFIAREHNRLLAEATSAVSSDFAKSFNLDEALRNAPESTGTKIQPTMLASNFNSSANTIDHEVQVETENGHDFGLNKPKKRKAAEISGPDAVDEQIVDCAADDSRLASTPTAAPIGAAPSPVLKRLRTAAEFLGVAAFGGAAVMTALIATAPNF